MIAKCRKRWVAAAGILASLAIAPRAEAQVLYTQPPTVGNGTGAYTTWTSSYIDSNYDYYLTLDNFQVSSQSAITSISWQGMYLNYDFGTNSYSNGTPNGGDWIIELYTPITDGSASNFPFLYYNALDIPASEVTETLAGTTTFGSATVDFYNESVQLPPGFLVQGGQTYDLEIFSYNTEPSSLWSWMSGSGGDGTSFQYSSSADATTQVSGDRAFTLYAAAVPEPSSFLLGAIGAASILGCVFGRQRRKDRAILLAHLLIVGSCRTRFRRTEFIPFLPSSNRTR